MRFVWHVLFEYCVYVVLVFCSDELLIDVDNLQSIYYHDQQAEGSKLQHKGGGSRSDESREVRLRVLQLTLRKKSIAVSME